MGAAELESLGVVAAGGAEEDSTLSTLSIEVVLSIFGVVFVLGSFVTGLVDEFGSVVVGT